MTASPSFKPDATDLSSNLGALTSIVRDNARPSPQAPIPRISLAYLSTAFASGFALGAVVGLFSADAIFSFRRRDNNYENRILEEVEAIKCELQQLRSNGRVGPVAFEAYIDDDEGSEDDEFFDVASGMSSNTNVNLSICSSSAVSRVSLLPLPSSVAKDLDALAEAARLADITSVIDLAGRAFSRCLDYKKQYKYYPGFLWRLARAANLMWMASSSLATMDITKNGSPDGHWVDVGLSISRSAVRMADAATATMASTEEEEVATDAARAYQWLAVFLGLSANASTAASQRIQLGYEFEKCINVSLELDPNNAYCHILKGRWCYEVYSLSWLERQIATRLFATPPTATLEESMAQFLEAERLEPDHWVVNEIFLAKCEFAGSNYAEAIQWLEKAETLLRRCENGENEGTGGDERSTATGIGDPTVERPVLLAEIAQLMQLYRSYLPYQ